MKYWVKISLIFLIIASCQEKSNSITEDEFQKRDTLNLPHFPYIDYDETFQGEKLSISDYDEKYNFVKSFFENYWDYNKVSGGLLVAKNGQIIYENYRGYANRETKDTLTADTPIHIASISKVLTAIAILKLVEGDKIKLDQLVSNFYEAFPYKNITIRDLLTHRSGLPNYAYFEHNPDYWDTKQVQTNFNVLEALIHKVGVPNAAPNSNFAYSNTNYALLALIIEKATGLAYPQAMKYIVFDPLKMDNTFVFDMEDSEKVSQSYTFKNVRWDFNFLDNIYGDKNIYSTPRDLFKMDKAMYSKKFLSSKIKKDMKKGYSYEKKGVKNYGLGIRMMEWDSGEKLWYHNGWWHGNYTTYVRGENDSITIVALGNRQVRSVYTAFQLIGLLGDYPVILEQDGKVTKGDTSKMSEDSLLRELKAVKEKQSKSEGKLNENKHLISKDSLNHVNLPKIKKSRIDSLKKKISSLK